MTAARWWPSVFATLASLVGLIALDEIERPAGIAGWLALAGFGPALALVLARQPRQAHRWWIVGFGRAVLFALFASALALAPRLALVPDPVTIMWNLPPPLSQLLWPVAGVALVGTALAARTIHSGRNRLLSMSLTLAAIGISIAIVLSAVQRLALARLDAEVWILLGAVALISAAGFRAGSPRLHRVWPLMLAAAVASERLSWWYLNPALAQIRSEWSVDFAGGRLRHVFGDARDGRLRVNWLVEARSGRIVARELTTTHYRSDDGLRIAWWECRPAGGVFHTFALAKVNGSRSKHSDRLDACELKALDLRLPVLAPVLIAAGEQPLAVALAPSGDELALATRDALELRATADAHLVRREILPDHTYGGSPEYRSDDVLNVTATGRFGWPSMREIHELQRGRPGFTLVAREPVIQGQRARSGDGRFAIGDAVFAQHGWTALYDAQSGEPMIGLLPHSRSSRLATFLGDGRIVLVAMERKKPPLLHLFSADGLPLRTVTLPRRAFSFGDETGEDCIELFTDPWRRGDRYEIDLR